MAYSTIVKPGDYFNTKLYSGSGSASNITGVGFQPDWVWIKCRTNAVSHSLNDSVRGANKQLESNDTGAETSFTNALTSFNSDGFTVDTSGETGQSGRTYVAWNWKANGSGSANTDGTISSTVSANTTSGFSIVSYTGNGNGNSTIGHGLGATPKFIIVKNRTTTQEWGTLSDSFVSASDPNILYLSKTSAQADDTNVWGTSASFNNNTFTVGDWNGSNQSGQSFIAYCFAEKTGYSKFGSYTGNGNADGTFVYTGFKPAFIMTKNSVYTSNWVMKDNKRSGTSALQDFGQMNPNQTENPSANLNTEENKASAFAVDILSNGFKMRGVDNAGSNWDGNKYIYMAFAEEPLVANVGASIPATAR